MRLYKFIVRILSLCIYLLNLLLYQLVAYLGLLSTADIFERRTSQLTSPPAL
jgi:hypothetical protein